MEYRNTLGKPKGFAQFNLEVDKCYEEEPQDTSEKTSSLETVTQGSVEQINNRVAITS